MYACVLVGMHVYVHGVCVCACMRACVCISEPGNFMVHILRLKHITVIDMAADL